jgi:deoxyribonuclease-4
LYQDIRSITTHASYLINIASDNPVTRHQSVEALIEELKRCDLLEIPYLILHPGSSLSKEEGLARIAHSIDSVFKRYHGATMLLLENMAGQGSALAATFEDLAAIRHMSEEKRHIGFCFDTCHAFAAGYDFRDHKSYTHLWHDYDRIIGLQHLKVIHCNDSKKGLGSAVDRHADIGEGSLGADPFRMLLHDSRFSTIPKIIETPMETLDDHQKTLIFMRKLAEKKE